MSEIELAKSKYVIYLSAFGTIESKKVPYTTDIHRLAVLEEWFYYREITPHSEIIIYLISGPANEMTCDEVSYISTTLVNYMLMDKEEYEERGYGLAHSNFQGKFEDSTVFLK